MLNGIKVALPLSPTVSAKYCSIVSYGAEQMLIVPDTWETKRKVRIGFLPKLEGMVSYDFEYNAGQVTLGNVYMYYKTKDDNGNEVIVKHKYTDKVYSWLDVAQTEQSIATYIKELYL